MSMTTTITKCECRPAALMRCGPTSELTRRRESKHPSPHQASCETRSPDISGLASNELLDRRLMHGRDFQRRSHDDDRIPSTYRASGLRRARVSGCTRAAKSVPAWPPHGMNAPWSDRRGLSDVFAEWSCHADPSKITS